MMSIQRILNAKFEYIVAVSLLITLSWALLIDQIPKSDQIYYNENAISISRGDGYDPNAFWPVGYSAFLGLVYSIFGQSLVVARIANALLYVGVVACTFSLTRSWFKSRQQALLTVLILLSYTGFLVYISLIMPEVLFTFLLLASLVLVQWAVSAPALRRVPGLLLAGMLLGTAILVRPQYFMFPLVVIFSLHFVGQLKQLRSTLTAAALVMLGVGVALAPWMTHLYSRFNQFVLVSTNGGYNLFMGNNPYADGTYLVDTVESESAILDLGYDLSAATDAAERDVLYRQAAIDYMVSDPLGSLRLIPAKFLYYCRHELSGWLLFGGGKFQDGMLRKTVMAISQSLYVLHLILSVAGILLYGTRILRSSAIIAISFMLYSVLIAVIFIGMSRYRIPTVPFMAMFSAYALIHAGRLPVQLFPSRRGSPRDLSP